MIDPNSIQPIVPERLQEIPVDLATIVSIVLATNVVVFVPVIRETSLRASIGLAFVLFAPGYVIVAALFPRSNQPSSGSSSEHTSVFSSTLSTDRRGIDGIERVALAFGASVAVVPIVGLLLNFSPWSVGVESTVLAVSAITLIAATVATVRRFRVPEPERFRVSFSGRNEGGRREVRNSRADTALTALVALLIVLAVGAVAYSATVPSQDERFSSIYLLTEQNGEVVADEYPTEFGPNESRNVVVGVDNHEHRTIEYTVVALEQIVEPGDAEPAVREQRELGRLEIELDHGEQSLQRQEIEPTLDDEEIRIIWLLFPENNVPAEPSATDTEYHVHLWVEVEAAM